MDLLELNGLGLGWLSWGHGGHGLVGESLIDSFIACLRLSNSACKVSFHVNAVLWADSFCKRGNVSMTPGQNFSSVRSCRMLFVLPLMFQGSSDLKMSAAFLHWN